MLEEALVNLTAFAEGRPMTEEEQEQAMAKVRDQMQAQQDAEAEKAAAAQQEAEEAAAKEKEAAAAEAEAKKRKAAEAAQEAKKRRVEQVAQRALARERAKEQRLASPAGAGGARDRQDEDAGSAEAAPAAAAPPPQEEVVEEAAAPAAAEEEEVVASPVPPSSPAADEGGTGEAPAAARPSVAVVVAKALMEGVSKESLALQMLECCESEQLLLALEPGKGLVWPLHELLDVDTLAKVGGVMGVAAPRSNTARPWATKVLAFLEKVNADHNTPKFHASDTCGACAQPMPWRPSRQGPAHSCLACKKSLHSAAFEGCTRVIVGEDKFYCSNKCSKSKAKVGERHATCNTHTHSTTAQLCRLPCM